MRDQVAYISLLTAAMEVNNVIGHALEETPSRIKEALPLPPCDGMESLNDGVYKENRPSTGFFKAHIAASKTCLLVRHRLENTHF